MDTLQRSTCVGDQSGVDMEKYLKKTDISLVSEASVAQTTFNLTGWGDGIDNSQVDNQVLKRLTIQEAQEKERSTAEASLAKVSPSKASSQAHKGDSRRSSIPRPCSSSRVFAGAEQSSTVKPKAEIVGACHKSSLSSSKTSSNRTFTIDADNAKALEQQAASIKKAPREASQGSNKGCADSSCLPRTLPVSRAEQSSLSCLDNSSAPPPSAKGADQPQLDKPNVSVEKKPTLRDATSEEKHVGFSQPTPNPTSGKWTGLLLRVFSGFNALSHSASRAFGDEIGSLSGSSARHAASHCSH